MGTRATPVWVVAVTTALIGCNTRRSVETSDANTKPQLDGVVVARDRGVVDQRSARDRAAPDVTVPKKYCVMWCKTKADCPAPLPYCVNSRCVHCVTDADCFPLYKGGCDTSLGACRMCSVDGHCWSNGVKLLTGKCSSAGVCIGCDTSVDCEFSGSVFDHCRNGQCVMCTSDADCAFGFSKCQASTGHCVCANDAECCKVAGGSTGCGLICGPGGCECLDDATCINTYGSNFRCR